ncbi:uncharacterized protein [Rutidosis leptorrhynchoides]|uniref:uncharacterized protein isoform X3 n=1 Tax=Rutidosis leptorrhynchoides TaxID=125765 RepID=UPI003A98FB52
MKKCHPEVFKRGKYGMMITGLEERSHLPSKLYAIVEDLLINHARFSYIDIPNPDSYRYSTLPGTVAVYFHNSDDREKAREIVNEVEGVDVEILTRI